MNNQYVPKAKIVSSSRCNKSHEFNSSKTNPNSPTNNIKSLSSCICQLSYDTLDNPKSFNQRKRNTKKPITKRSRSTSDANIIGDNNHYPQYFPWLVQDPRWYHYHKDSESESHSKISHQSYDIRPETPYACKDIHTQLDISLMHDLRNKTPGGQTSIHQSPRSKKRQSTLPANALKRSLRNFNNNTKYWKPPPKPNYIHDHKYTKFQKSKVRNKPKQKQHPRLRQRRPTEAVININKRMALVVKFKELLKSKVVLKGNRFAALREIFRIMDADHSGSVTHDEVIKFNIYIDPYAEIDDIERDANLLFKLADFDNNGYITEQEWLRGWSEAAKVNADNLNTIDAFIAAFHSVTALRAIEAVHVKQISKFGWNTLKLILKWKNRAIEAVKKRSN